MLMMPLPALAGVLYKCIASDGQIAFTNKIGNFRNCKKVASYLDAPAAKPQSTLPAPRVEYHSASSSLQSENAIVRENVEGKPVTPDSKEAPAATKVQRGAVYKVSHANGVTEYTNVRPKQPGAQLLFTYIATCYACNVNSNVDWDHTKLRLDVYSEEINKAAADYGVDAALLRAVIHAESAFNPNALSNKGAQGLMQLMPGTASDLNVNNPFDPEENIRGGAQYLAMLLKNFNGDMKLATAAYNAGEANVRKYDGIPPFDETKIYVERVALLHERYQKAQ